LWCGDTALKVAFPALFGIASVKDASVADNLEFLGGSNRWNVSFTRESHNWEVDDFASFFQALHSVKVRRGRKDKMWRVSSKKGLLKVKFFFYSLLSCRSCILPESLFLEKCLAHTQALSRAAFFAWSATLGKILTLDNFRRLHVIVINICYICKNTG